MLTENEIRTMLNLPEEKLETSEKCFGCGEENVTIEELGVHIKVLDSEGKLGLQAVCTNCLGSSEVRDRMKANYLKVIHCK